MGQIENIWRQGIGRRKALLGLAGVLGGSALMRAQQDPTPAGGLLKDHPRALGIDEMMTAFDFEPVYKSNVSLAQFDYIATGSDSEWTTRRNREAFGWVDIVSHPAVDAATVNTSTDLFGVKMDNPFFVAPSGLQYGTHPEGTPAMRRGASDAKTLMFIPQGVGGPGVPTDKAWVDTLKASNAPFFWQFYPNRDLKASRELLEKMQADGARAIVITCDEQSPYYPRGAEDQNLRGGSGDVRRETFKRNRKTTSMGGPHPERGTCTNCHVGQPPANAKETTPTERDSKARWWYTWEYLDQIREFIKVPMIAKGIITPEDAELCIQHGLDGIYVSNHGGRSLCYEPAAIEVFPEILAAVRGRVPLLFDSGVRCGADAFKALALGAKAVGMGRPPRWALGAYGAPGVTRLLQIMQKEFVATMAKAGQPTVASLDQTAVKTHFV